jgi:septal ring factor EnvC (AmiA/AmiB activator)
MLLESTCLQMKRMRKLLRLKRFHTYLFLICSKDEAVSKVSKLQSDNASLESSLTEERKKNKILEDKLNVISKLMQVSDTIISSFPTVL